MQGRAQVWQQEVDSILALPVDSNQVMGLNDIGHTLRKSAPGEARAIFKKAFVLAESIDFQKGIAVLEKNTSLSFYYERQMDSAMVHALRSLDLAREIGELKLQGSVHNNIGNIYFTSGNFEGAHESYTRSLEIKEQINDRRGMAKALGSLGNLANAQLKNTELALQYYNRSLEIDKEINNLQGISITSTNLANIHAIKGNYALALKLNKEALRLDLQRGDLYDVTFSYGNLGNIFRRQEQHDSALFYYQKQLAIADSIGSATRQSSAYKRLSLAYQNTGEYKKAYEYATQYQQLSDSLRKSSSAQKIERIKAEYDRDIDQKQIALLEARNELNEAKIEKQRLRNTTLGAFVLVLVLGVGLLLVQLRINRRQARKLYTQKNELERRTEEIERANTEVKDRNQKLRKALERLQTAQNQLIESEKLASIGTLTSGLAHELNNPLNFIGGVVDPLKKDLEELKVYLDPKKRQESENILDEISELLGHVDEGANKASTIIQSLLEISPHQKRDEKTRIDLKDLILSTTRLIQSGQYEVNFDIETEGDTVFYGNPVELNQVFLNIIKNSIEALSGKGKGTIEIRITADEDKVHIYIKDNGSGIRDSIRKEIFQPFFTTKEPGMGTGLGLYIAQSIVKKHLGQIRLESQIGKGTLAHIWLPIEKKPS